MEWQINQHARKRYVERIDNIKEDINLYANQNQEKINKKINKMMEFSQFIWKGNLKGKESARYFLSGDGIILVCNAKKDIVITLYRVDYNYTQKINKELAKMLMDSKITLEERREKLIKEREQFLEAANLNIENLRDEIKTKENELVLLKTKLNILEKDKEYSMEEIMSINKEIDTIAKKICNSLDFQNIVSDL